MNIFLCLSIVIFICILFGLKYNYSLFHDYINYNKYINNDEYNDYDDNKDILSYQLRNVYIESIVDEIYRPIYFNIIKTAINGKNSTNFKLMCFDKSNCTSHHKWNSGKSSSTGLQPSASGVLHKYTKKLNIIKSNIIRNRIIYKLQNAFPDSNITKYYKNCCEYYKVTW
jgi:hypothetical protein